MKYPYSILGVAENATQEEIRRAYLEKLKEFPPEKNPEKFQEVSDSYHLVENDLARAKLLVFGIPRKSAPNAKMSDLLPSDCGIIRRPGMEFWLKLFQTERKNV